MNTSIEYRDEDDTGYIIEGYVEAYTPAKLHGHPDSWHPAEGGGVVDIEVWKMDALGNKGEAIDYDEFLKLPGVKADSIEEKLSEAYQDAGDDGYDEPDDYDRDDY